MPLLKLETTEPIIDTAREPLMRALSKITAETIGKPESYVMVSITPAAMIMGGEPGPTAYVAVHSIGGLNGTVNRTLTQKICQTLGETLSIPSDRVYVSFHDSAASHWGWDNRTFG